MALALSQDVGVALNALSLVPGAGAIAQGLSLTFSLLGESSGPRIRLPMPFRPASFLWGVPRRLTGPRRELSFRVTYDVRPVGGGASVLGGSGFSSTAKPGAKTTGLPEALGSVAGFVSGTVDPHELSEAPTSQAPPYDLSRPHGRLPRNLTALDVIWAEALRRGHVESMAGDVIHAFDGTAELAIHVGDVYALSGWWDSYTDEAGGPVSDVLEQELRAAYDRRNALVDPYFDDLDTRPWSLAWRDRWLDFAGRNGANAAGSLASWKNANSGPAAAEREAWDLSRELVLDDYEERGDQWDEWRFLLNAQLVQQQTFDQAAADWQKAWQEAVFAGYDFETAAQIANQTFALDGIGGGSSAASSPASSSGALPKAIGIGAIIALLFL